MSQVSEEVDADSKIDVNFPASACPIMWVGETLIYVTLFRQTKHKRQRNVEQQSGKGTQGVTAIRQIINSAER